MSNKDKEPRMVGGGTTIIAGGKSGGKNVDSKNPMAATNKITPETSKEVVKELRKQSRTHYGAKSHQKYSF